MVLSDGLVYFLKIKNFFLSNPPKLSCGFKVVLQFCNIWIFALPQIYSPCARFSEAHKTNKVAMDRQINRLAHDT